MRNYDLHPFFQPGGLNPRVTLWVVDLTDLENEAYKDIKPPDAVKSQLVTHSVWFVGLGMGTFSIEITHLLHGTTEIILTESQKQLLLELEQFNNY